jgi:DNA-binding transcriptional ArsR family regulator
VAVVPIALLQDPEEVRLALSPIRRRLLARLREPASATALAAELELPRQRVNYHLRALEAAGLIELVEERRRRGCVERILVARADAYVVDPAVMGALGGSPDAQDRFAARHLVATAADVVRDVARMQAAAQREGTRLLTFTVETEVRLAAPADVERLAGALAERLAAVVAEFDAPVAGRRYRVVAGGHPARVDHSERSDR